MATGYIIGGGVLLFVALLVWAAYRAYIHAEKERIFIAARNKGKTNRVAREIVNRIFNNQK